MFTVNLYSIQLSNVKSKDTNSLYNALEEVYTTGKITEAQYEANISCIEAEDYIWT